MGQTRNKDTCVEPVVIIQVKDNDVCGGASEKWSDFASISFKLGGGLGLNPGPYAY